MEMGNMLTYFDLFWAISLHCFTLTSYVNRYINTYNEIKHETPFPPPKIYIYIYRIYFPFTYNVGSRKRNKE